MKLLTVLALCLSFNFSFANDFLGKNTIYSETSSNYFAMETNLNDDGTGTIITFNGNSDVTWTEDADGKLSLKLETPVSLSTVKFVESTNPEIPGVVEVKMTHSLTDITLAQAEAVRVESLWIESADDGSIEDVMRTDVEENLSMYTEFAKHEFTAEEGMRMVLPSVGVEGSFGQVHVELGETMATTVRSFKGFPFDEMIWSLSDDKMELNLSVPNVASISYRLIQKGLVNKVIANITIGTKKQILSRHMSYDAQVPQELVTEEAVKGSYLATVTSSDTDLTYHFGENNLGGFDYTNEGEKRSNYWSWKVADGVIMAQQYYILDESNLPIGRPTSEEEVAQCLDKTLKCRVRSQREYRILAVEVDTYSLLRQYSVIDENGVTLRQDSSLWVFEKQQD